MGNWSFWCETRLKEDDKNTCSYLGLYFLVTKKTCAFTPGPVEFYYVLAAAESLYLC